MKSIIPNDDENCFLCKQVGRYVKGTDKHHMIFGTAKRKLAEEDGLFCQLCHSHHMNLHQQGLYKVELQVLAQKTWQDHYGKTKEDFIARYGKSYL